MAATITFTEKEGQFSLSEINSLFNDIATVLNAKVDKTDETEYTVGDDMDRVQGRTFNLPYAVDDDELVPRSQFLELL